MNKLFFTLTCLLLAVPCTAKNSCGDGMLGCDHPPLGILTSQAFQIETLQTNQAYSGRFWDADNPFHQPVATTDYYGSGDVDNDGNLTPADVALAQEMADGITSPCIRADVDANGVVNNNDVSLINSALGGEVLPGWWNSLTTRQERNAWVDKILAIDQTDAHFYRAPWFICFGFASQINIHGAFYRGDLHDTYLNGGPTVFNLPIYEVTGAGHVYNGILVGDDPLNLDDWRLFEPQTDVDYSITAIYGAPDVYLSIYSPSFQLISGSATSIGTNREVQFYIGQTDWTLYSYNTDLVLTRPSPPIVIPDNRPDLWNPTIIPSGSGIILFDRVREDMSRVTDIHVANLPFSDPPEASPLVLSSQYSRLLDTCKGPDGTLHLLWKGKPDYVPGVFHGTLDPVTKQLSNVTRVSTGTRAIRMGRIVVTKTNEVHVFWLEFTPSDSMHINNTGIYWTKWTGSNWQSEENIAPKVDYIPFYDYTYSWGDRNLLRHYFGVDTSGDNDINLLWVDPNDATGQGTIRQLHYDGQWGTITDVETDDICGIEIIADSAGVLHMAYWLGDRDYSANPKGKGNLLHRTSSDNGISWSAAETVDTSGMASCPRMVAGSEGAVYLVWERQIDTQVLPVWNRYESGAWGTQEILSVRTGADAWYPTLEFFQGGRVLATWSSRSSDRVTIEMETIAPYVGDFDLNDKVDVDDLRVLAAQWLQVGAYLADIAPLPDGDNIVNMLDFAKLAENWLKGE